MKPSQAVAVLSCLPPCFVSGTKRDLPLQYANHLFNSIHSSMRQFGSSLNHNGMSLFIATIPQDTEFYHGTQSPYRVNGTEWLAFEPEHAMLFARSWARGPPGKGGPPQHPPPLRTEDHNAGSFGFPGCDDIESFDHGRHPANLRQRQHSKNRKRWNFFHQEEPLIASNEDDDRYGYLHTYRTKHDLRLLYLDGQSAAKSDKGTLDIQDLVLLHDNPLAVNEKGPGGPMGEGKRASSLCKLAQDDWEGRIDGFLRMEGGFGIILCEFPKDLDLVRISQTQDGNNRLGEDNMNYYQAVAARYDGIGGGRVTLDYEDFISLFVSESALYFDQTGRPRVNNDSTNAIMDVRNQIDDMVLRHQKPGGMNWQEVADMVVGRYARRIQYLASGDIEDIDRFKAEIDLALRPFIDYSDRNRTTEIARCATQFFPTQSMAGSKAARAIHSVTSTICKTLSAASIIDTTAHGLSMIRALKDWLAWTEWKKCQGCASNEVCFLPIWPVGSESDFQQPKCRSDIRSARGTYWDGFGRPPKDEQRA